MKNRDISNTDDIIDVRDIIARVEELEPDSDQAVLTAEGNMEEWRTLSSLLTDLRGYGGDEQWRGDWYPVTLIRDSHFQAYAEELAEDCGMINSDATWPNNCIDWEEAARQLQQDYGTVDYDGVTYWYR